MTKKPLKLQFHLRSLLLAIVVLCGVLTVTGIYHRDRQVEEAYDVVHAMGFNSTVGSSEHEHKRYIAEFSLSQQRPKLTQADAARLLTCLATISTQDEIKRIDLGQTDVKPEMAKALKSLLPDADVQFSGQTSQVKPK